MLPVSTPFFLLTGPHAWLPALLWTLPIWLCVAADYVSPTDRAAPRPGGMEWRLDARLYAWTYVHLLHLSPLALQDAIHRPFA